MPSRLRPTSSLAAEAILVGDPGRALLLAQELLDQPKMSNHARGLWGYTGRTPAGRDLTVQSTGMGGPSAAIVLGDLGKLGVRRAIRVGTCTALDPELAPGRLLVVSEAHAWGGGGGGEPVHPDAELTAALRAELGEELGAAVASLDTLHRGGAPGPVRAGDAADMQTASLFVRGTELDMRLAAVLIVTEGVDGEDLSDELSEAAAKRAGKAAAAALTSN